MFTGIIEEYGKIQTIGQNKIGIKADIVTEGTNTGDSIAVNGVCLTVTKINSDGFDADISPETMRVTALGDLKTGDYVNLERAVQVGSRLGGHIVTGHIDSKGVINKIEKTGDFYNVEIKLTEESSRCVVKKGSLTVDGISLTVADIQGEIVKLAIIPHTFENTNLKTLQKGKIVNIETDILSKYVEKFLSTRDNRSGISVEFLMEHGF